MEKLLVLGTGGGLTTKCYNTCFLLQNHDQYFLVDTGAGAQILNQIQKANVTLNQVHDIFISHKHVDHLLGIFPLLRVICRDIPKNKYQGNVNLYCAKEVHEIIERFILDTFHDVHIDVYHKNVIFHEIENEQEYSIIGYQVKMLDLYPNKFIEFGFQTKLNNGKVFTFLGDVPCSEKNVDKIRNTDWVCHEVFCREAENDLFHPHQINHSTVKDVSQAIQDLDVKNLVLWHTKDNCIEERKELYTKEAKEYFKGNIYVPDDLEVIEL